MEEATENKEETTKKTEETSETAEQPTESIEEKIVKQTETVKKLEDSYEKKPSDNLQLELYRERDLLRHLKNTQTASTRDRAEKMADFARETTLGKAIVQVPQE
jgi:hypothetical protein